MTTYIHNPKTVVYSALNALGYSCKQGNQAVFNSVPAITFTVGDMQPQYDLSKNILGSVVEMVVDVWANDSVTTSRVAKEAEVAMRNIDYLLTYFVDVPNPEGSLYHIQMRFESVVPN